jgi:DNA repair exonuclease SbcCD ATPase subunit
MKILKIEWRNFSSYGNKKQVLSFPEESCLFQVVGENGAGKTSISQVICFALYGKIEGKKLGDIPNRINGNAWVKIEFENNQRIITVERGLEPSIFNLFINGILYDQAGQKNIQEYLSEELIGIPYYVFNNTISLSINDFKSFIKMSPQDKRAIVDKIFGFHILNQMREVIKGESKKIKEKTDIISAQVQTAELSLQRSTSEMESLLTKIEENTQNELASLEKSLQDFVALQAHHSQKVSEFKSVESEFQRLVSDSQRILIETQTRLSDVRRKLKLYQGENCPTCQTKLDGEVFDRIREELVNEESKYISQIKDAEENRKKLSSRESELQSQKSSLAERSSKISSRIQEISKSISALKNKKAEDQVSSLQKIIKQLDEERSNLQSDAVKSAEKSLWLKTLDDILSEKGVKQMAIKTILPALNSEISELLSDLHLDYQVFFDEEFKASIYHMGIEIPNQTLSTGEMKKVDFVVLISIMKLMKFKFSSINLLFLDELFSSVDPDGVNSILSILKKNCKLLGLNIFVINHAPMPHEIFDWKIDVKKSNNFSSITVDKF